MEKVYINNYKCLSAINKTIKNLRITVEITLPGLLSTHLVPPPPSFVYVWAAARDPVLLTFVWHRLEQLKWQKKNK